MLPQSSSETKTVKSHWDCSKLCIYILIFMIIIGASSLLSAKTELNKVRNYKQGECILKSAMVYIYRRGKNSEWKARWTVLLEVSNTSGITITFTEPVPGSYFTIFESTASKYTAQRQVWSYSFLEIPSNIIAIYSTKIISVLFFLFLLTHFSLYLQ